MQGEAQNLQCCRNRQLIRCQLETNTTARCFPQSFITEVSVVDTERVVFAGEASTAELRAIKRGGNEPVAAFTGDGPGQHQPASHDAHHDSVDGQRGESDGHPEPAGAAAGSHRRPNRVAVPPVLSGRLAAVGTRFKGQYRFVSSCACLP